MATTESIQRQAEEVVLPYFRGVWQRGEFDTDAVTDDYVVHNLNVGAEALSLDEWRELHEADRRAFPDLHKEPQDVVAADDRVVVRYTATATHEGPFKGMPPTGEEIEIAGVATYRLEDGKIAESWYLGDFLGLMTQIGAVEGPSQ